MVKVEKLSSPPTFIQIQQVHDVIQPFIHRTPVCHSSSLNRITGASIYFKSENFQKVGAFKMRGASSAVAALTAEEKSKGIATHSSGNHAQAVALTAKLHGIPAHIVMPENAPSIKRNAVKEYEANIYTSGNRIEEREQKMEDVLAITGATFIHPYNNFNIIAGQATAVKELIEDIPDLEIIMAPVGGGGLMSGTALSTRYMLPSAKIYGVEPTLVDDAFRSFHSGRIESNDRINTIADGLRTNLGDKTLAIIRAHVDDILTVSEASIVQAMQLIWERVKIVVEPSGAVPLAAVLEKPGLFTGKKVGIIVSGGNVDVHHLPF
jgi:threonine dehydratase